MSWVVDAWVAIEVLLKTPIGQRLAPQLIHARLVAPELIDAEVLHVTRGLERGGQLTARRAAEVIADLASWPLERSVSPAARSCPAMSFGCV